MKLNKYIFATLITSTTLFLGSCSDFLDRSPQGQFTEDDNPNALVNGKIYNVYTMMRNYNVTAGLLLLPSTVFVRKIRKKEVLPAMALM
ncbi:hypothetical protein NXW64_08815 [Bacteroides ovatus]|nr:hypothetical protein NXW64_08815 [Bacteroides ovatus]